MFKPLYVFYLRSLLCLRRECSGRNTIIFSNTMVLIYNVRFPYRKQTNKDKKWAYKQRSIKRWQQKSESLRQDYSLSKLNDPLKQENHRFLAPVVQKVDNYTSTE